MGIDSLNMQDPKTQLDLYKSGSYDSLVTPLHSFQHVPLCYLLTATVFAPPNLRVSTDQLFMLMLGYYVSGS